MIRENYQWHKNVLNIKFFLQEKIMKVMTKDEIDVLLKADLSKPLKDEEKKSSTKKISRKKLDEQIKEDLIEVEKLLRGEKNSIKELEEDVFETI